MDVFRRQKFNEAMFSKNRTLAIRVGNYQSRDINEASFDYGYIKGDTYKPGGTCAGSGKITFTSIITTFNKLDKIYPEIGLLVDGTYEWVKMGEYFINDIEIDRNRNTTTLELMDGMFKLNREHVTDLTYPAEIRNVIKEICLKTGVELANETMGLASMNYRIDKVPKDKKMTFRDVLGLSAQMLGMSCFFNREGKLEVKELTDSGIVITADSYFMHGLTKSEIEYQIAGITCKKDKETLTVGLRTGRSLELDNLFMSQSVLDNLYHNIKDIRYYPFSLNYQGHLLLDVGQWVTIKTNTGETFKSPVLSQSFKFKGGLRGRISADSKAGNDAQYSYAGTITKKIEQFNEFEAQLQNQIEEADKEFDRKVQGIKGEITDGIEQAKAVAEENKKKLSDVIDSKFNDFDTGINEKLDEQKNKLNALSETANNAYYNAFEALKDSSRSLKIALSIKDMTDSNFMQISQINDTIETLARKSELDPISDRLSITESKIEVQAGQIIEKLSRTDFDRLANDRGFQTATQVQNTVNKSVNGFQQTISRIETKLRDVIRNDNLLQNSSIIPSGDGLNGSWGLYLSGGNGRTDVIELRDAPHAAIKKGMRVVNNTNGGNKDIGQKINLVVGEKYTMSCWARVSSNSTSQNVNLLMRSWTTNDRNRIFVKYISNKDWVRYQFTFTADAVSNSIQFGQNGNGSLEICGMKLEHSDRMTDYDISSSEIVSIVEFNDVRDTVSSHTQTLQRQDKAISQVIQTADGLVSRVSNFLDDFNLVYDPTNLSKWVKKQAEANVIVINADTKLLRITNVNKPQAVYHGFALPLNTSSFTKGEKLSYRMEVWVDVLPDAPLGIELWAEDGGFASDRVTFTRTGTQIITGTMTVQRTTSRAREFPLEFWLMKNGTVAIGKVSLIRGDIPPKKFIDNTNTQDVVTQTRVAQLSDSYAIQTLTSPGAVTSQINLAPNEALIEANKIRLKGKTLADEITAIDGYFKRLFVGDARIGKLNTDIIESNSITADKVIMDSAMAKKIVSSDVFTDQLAAKNAFINKLRSVVVSATLLEGYKGRIGGFQIGTHDKDPSTYWLTGTNQFAVGMSNGNTKWGQTALWVNWGNDWAKPDINAWYVKRTGEMYCYNQAHFWKTPVIHGDLKVSGNIYYITDDDTKQGGYWIYSPQYKKISSENGYMYFYFSGGGSSWIPMNKEISDRRYKTNIQDSKVSALDVVDKLKTYSYRKEYDDKVEEIACGIMAQDIQKYVPEAFYKNPDGAYSYRTFELVPYLIKAIQELNQKVERLEKTT
nr:MAG TPA: Neck appendage protein [Caudoviricetes sp.]